MKNYLNKELGKEIFVKNLTKIMKLMLPFTPHLAHECLALLNCTSVKEWPEIDKKNILNEIKIAVQINGKTRDILSVNKNLIESQINEIILQSSKAKKYIENKKITKTIFIKNKIINYIILH